MNEKLDALIQKRVDVSLPVAIGVGILTVGGSLAVGYILGRRPGKPKPLSKEDQDAVDLIRDNLAEMRDARKQNPVVDFSSFKEKSQAEEAAGIVIDEEAYKAKERVLRIHPQPPEEDPEPVTTNHATVRRNVFADQTDPEDDWNYELELQHRNSMTPYVIHRDEFFEESEEFDYQQHQLTWYNGDAVLCDEDNDPVFNHRDVVGDLVFGHGSGDPNVVYIRNERLKAEYEIWLSAGRYDVEVQGADMEDVTAEDIRHSAPRKFRAD